MTNREAFKIGFLIGCADQGIDGAGAVELMQKAAALLEKTGFMDFLQNTALTAGIALPAAAGAGLGYMAHRVNSPEIDADDVRTKEIINELKHWARRARETQKTKVLRSQA